MEVLVTGATGFVGRHLGPRLLAEGHSVRALSRRGSRTHGDPRVRPVAGDVTDLASLRAAVDGADAVVHLVAIIVERKDLTYSRVNHLGTENVVRAMRDAGVPTLVHQSALGVGPDRERFPYLHSKWLGEEAVRAGGIDHTILRAGVIHGPGAGFFKPIVWNLRWLPAFPLPGGGRTRFQPVHVDDVCSAIVSCLRSPKGTLDVAGPEILTFEQIVRVVMEALGKPRPTVRIPAWMARPFAWTQALRREPLVTSDQLDMIVLDNTTALDVVWRNFGFQPKRLGETDLRWLSEF